MLFADMGMNPSLMALLTLGRDNYEYPWARVIDKPSAGAIAIGPLCVSWYCQEKPHVVTDLALDNYHRDLLHSPGSGDRHLGCASTLYWGHFTRNPPFAQNKVLNFCAATTIATTSATVTMAAIDCAYGHWGKALGCFHGVNQLQRLPFASKVVAFIDPENAGVYDNRINRFVAETGLDRVLFAPNGAIARNGKWMANSGVNLTSNQTHYEVWCLRLQQARDALNTITPPATWICKEPTRQRWRAVDVERAIFALAAKRGLLRGSGHGTHGTPGLAITQSHVDESVRLLKQFFQERPLAASS
jgi:hypothetical protein